MVVFHVQDEVVQDEVVQDEVVQAGSQDSRLLMKKPGG